MYFIDNTIYSDNTNVIYLFISNTWRNIVMSIEFKKIIMYYVMFTFDLFMCDEIYANNPRKDPL